MSSSPLLEQVRVCVGTLPCWVRQFVYPSETVFAEESNPKVDATDYGPAEALGISSMLSSWSKKKNGGWLTKQINDLIILHKSDWASIIPSTVDLLCSLHSPTYSLSPLSKFLDLEWTRTISKPYLHAIEVGALDFTIPVPLNPVILTRLKERCYIGTHSCGNSIVVHVTEPKEGGDMFLEDLHVVLHALALCALLQVPNISSPPPHIFWAVIFHASGSISSDQFVFLKLSVSPNTPLNAHPIYPRPSPYTSHVTLYRTSSSASSEPQAIHECLRALACVCIPTHFDSIQDPSPDFPLNVTNNPCARTLGASMKQKFTEYKAVCESPRLASPLSVAFPPISNPKPRPVSSATKRDIIDARQKAYLEMEAKKMEAVTRVREAAELKHQVKKNEAANRAREAAELKPQGKARKAKQAKDELETPSNEEEDPKIAPTRVIALNAEADEVEIIRDLSESKPKSKKPKRPHQDAFGTRTEPPQPVEAATPTELVSKKKPKKLKPHPAPEQPQEVSAPAPPDREADIGMGVMGEGAEKKKKKKKKKRPSDDPQQTHEQPHEESLPKKSKKATD